MKKCENGCGDMIKIEKPATIFIDLEIMAYVSDYNRVKVAEEIVFCTKILRICPKCGYVETFNLTENQWNKEQESGL